MIMGLNTIHASSHWVYEPLTLCISSIVPEQIPASGDLPNKVAKSPCRTRNEMCAVIPIFCRPMYLLHEIRVLKQPPNKSKCCSDRSFVRFDGTSLIPNLLRNRGVTVIVTNEVTCRHYIVTVPVPVMAIILIIVAVTV